MGKQLYNNSAARSAEQLKKMEELTKRGVCIFCPENIDEYDESVEFESAYWIVKRNDYPYKRTSLHLLLVSKAHVKTVAELPLEAQQDFLSTVATVEQVYGLTSYAAGLRSGDMRYNGGSVEHLHAHIIVGDPDNEDSEPVRFKMSSRP